MDDTGDWPSRYRAGERDRVWLELRQQGSAVRDSPATRLQAQAVCDEMARRARRNVEVITARLQAQRYRFHSNDTAQAPRSPHHPPGPGAESMARWLTDRFDAVPMTLLSWLRIVGDVWWVGTHPAWSSASAGDPLVIELEGAGYPGVDMREDMADELDAWRDLHAQSPVGTPPFVLPVAPDRLHKNDVSGGEPHGIVLPDGCADGMFVGDVTLPFVSYLNRVFQTGGFPWPTGDPAQERIGRELSADLLPL